MRPPVEDALESRDQFAEAQRLGYPLVGGRNGVAVVRGEPGQDDNRDIRGPRPSFQLDRGLPAVQSRHEQVQNDHVRRVGCRPLKCLTPRAGRQDAVALIFQYRAQDLQQSRIVVTDQYRP